MELDVDENSVLIVRNSGPRGYPGMPEIGNLPMPKKLLLRGINDMVRISDARMSGSSYGTVVLHVAPESAIGGPLALVENGDIIELDVKNRLLQLDVSDEVLAVRRLAWKSPLEEVERGFLKLHHDHVLQADQGADLDFLVGNSGSAVPRRPF
jgi:dihydroxy-acid dehydratase